jgi:hypothetical protein
MPGKWIVMRPKRLNMFCFVSREYLLHTVFPVKLLMISTLSGRKEEKSDELKVGWKLRISG